MRERLAGLTESVHSLELQIHEKRLHVAGLLERAASELGLDEDILISEYGPDQAVPVDAATDDDDAEAAASVPYDRAQQRRRLQDAERKLAQLGRVNPLALEEFAALEQRHKFLDRAAGRPDADAQGPHHDHRGARRADAGDLPRRVRRHPRPRSTRCSRCCSPAAPAASR